MTLRVRSTAAALGFIVGALAAATTAAAPSDIEGVWRTEPRASGAFISVRIEPCAYAPEKRCGTVIGSHNGAPSDIVGDPILNGMEHRGGNRWGGGEIIRPGRGTRYSSELELTGEGLRVKGCVAGGLFCGAQIWTRP